MRIKKDVADRKGLPIGASSLGAHLGLSTYKTQYDAYLEYKGESPEPTEEQQKLFDMGHALEDFIAKRIEEEYGLKVQKSNYAYVDPSYPILCCHPDRLVKGLVNGERVAIEIKSSSAFDGRWGKEDTDEIPMDYMLQVMGYFICQVPCDVVWLVRFSNNRLTRYIIRPNQELIDDIKAKFQAHVDNLESGWIPSPANYEEATTIYHMDTHDAIEADSAILSAYSELKDIKEQKKALESREDELKTRIVDFMRDKALLMNGGQKLATYKMQSRNAFDSKRFEAEHPDIYSQYIKTSTAMVLRTY